MAEKNVLGRCDPVCIIMCENNCIKWEVVDEPRMAKNNVLERCDLLCVKVCGQPCPSHAHTSLEWPIRKFLGDVIPYVLSCVRITVSNGRSLTSREWPKIMF